tara:strand:- start:299 stop:538 length:240 start_codon:yes stop_codon:yes gene_type:complete
VALAIKNNPKLKTFSIGFDHNYFSECNYVDEVAQFIGSNHFKYIRTQEDFKKNFSFFYTRLTNLMLTRLPLQFTYSQSV